MIECPFFLSNNLNKTKRFESLDADSKEEILRFRDNGFLVIDLHRDENVLDQIVKDCLEEFEKVEYEGSGRSRIQNAFTFSESVKSLALNGRVLDFLRIAFGREPIPFQTLNFEKGSEQATHSDSIHFNTFPYGFMCGAWVALEDVDSENGPLHYYPGSHKLPFFGMDQFALHGTSDPDRPTYELYPQYEEGLSNLIENLSLQKESVTMKKGQCLIWAANLLHGGDPIIDESRTRFSQVTHYFFEDCFYYTPLLSSPFKNDFYARKPFNIASGKELDNKKLHEYALKAGINLDKISKKSTNKKPIFRSLFS